MQWIVADGAMTVKPEAGGIGDLSGACAAVRQ